MRQGLEFDVVRAHARLLSILVQRRTDLRDESAHQFRCLGRDSGGLTPPALRGQLPLLFPLRHLPQPLVDPVAPHVGHYTQRERQPRT